MLLGAALLLVVAAAVVLAAAIVVRNDSRRDLNDAQLDHRRERQAWASERANLLDRLAHQRGETWTLPPSWTEPPEQPSPLDGVPDNIVVTPESMVLTDDQLDDVSSHFA